MRQNKIKVFKTPANKRSVSQPILKTSKKTISNKKVNLKNTVKQNLMIEIKNSHKNMKSNHQPKFKIHKERRESTIRKKACSEKESRKFLKSKILKAKVSNKIVSQTKSSL